VYIVGVALTRVVGAISGGTVLLGQPVSITTCYLHAFRIVAFCISRSMGQPPWLKCSRIGVLSIHGNTSPGWSASKHKPPFDS